MDYEKKMTREEAIEKVRKMSLPKETVEILEALAPELRESEDERIRKALIEVFKEKLERGFEWVEYGIPNRSVLSWLEKQKEQKHPDGCFTCDEYKKGYEEGRRNGFTAGYNKAMKEVEQKEQKPVVTHGETYRVDTLGTQQVIAGKMPQKPAEIDEYKIIKKHITEDSLSSEVNKRLKECGWYVTDAEPAEWSEYDESYLQTVINEMEANKKEAREYEHKKYDTIISWLKSLRPQPKRDGLDDYMKGYSKGYADAEKEYNERTSYHIDVPNNWPPKMPDLPTQTTTNDIQSNAIPHWKPSEEQMEALKKVTGNAVDADEYYPALATLYYDLKEQF